MLKFCLGANVTISDIDWNGLAMFFLMFLSDIGKQKLAKILLVMSYLAQSPLVTGLMDDTVEVALYLHNYTFLIYLI